MTVVKTGKSVTIKEMIEHLKIRRNFEEKDILIKYI